ncbi:MAG: UTP--glucose-1-phosphate uridylyltransferase, partial [Actinobacteria bacterium]|nr:UTP--glucose-1-phosphate uridylyltransferase [Actinomycetota bacterium]
KATPKEMLPVVDKPAIQYVVEEAVSAGLSDVLFITGRNKTSLEDHFDRAPHLEQKLAEKNNDMSRVLSEIADLASIHYVRQGEPLGLGHAVNVARGHVGNEPFAVMLGDDLIDVANPILPRMLEVMAEFGGSVLCLMEVDPEDIHLYGCAAVEVTDQSDVVRVTGLVEKPKREEAPSNYAVIGRYVLQPSVFPILDTLGTGAGGEIQLTDALAQLISKPVEQGGGVHGVVFKGRRYDTGDKLSYLKSVFTLALDREEFGPQLRAWIEQHLASEN